MARQKGIIKIEGTVGGMTFYKTQDGHLVKEKSQISADRIANDSAFARTRENGAEFGASATAGKLLRDCLRTLMATASDNRVTSRLTAVMSSIKNEDNISLRGERTIANGLVSPSGKALIKGFDFNIDAKLGSIIFRPYLISPSGDISINNLNPLTDVEVPTGATHFRITAAKARIDFNTGEREMQTSTEVSFLIENLTTNIFLAINPVIQPNGNTFNLLKIAFFQEVNGTQYPLKNGAYNALTILDVQ